MYGTAPCPSRMQSVMNRTKRTLTPICGLHYVKLIYRTLLFLLAFIMYLTCGSENKNELHLSFKTEYWPLLVIWVVYTAEMACRFFPSRLESMGSQKQFRSNYAPTGEETPQLLSWRRTLTVVLAWAFLNGVIGALYFADLIGRSVLILISLFYGVCDMICILFFCPFRTWFMKNRCCTVCRIYNWDFAMMFTPLLFIPSVYTWSLLTMSLLLLLRWEITYRRHPERFSDRTNACLRCENCREKLCRHQKQLRRLRRKNR